MSTVIRRLIGVGLLVVVFLSAWGGGASENSSPPVISHVVSKPSAQALRAVGIGATALLGATVNIKLSVSGAPALGGNAELVGAFDFQRHQGRFTLTPGGTDEHESLIYRLTSVYVHQAVTARSTKPWLLYNVAESPKVPSGLNQPMSQLQGFNPAPIVAALAWGLFRASAAGTDSVDGVTVRRYVATVDIGKATAFASGDAEAQAAADVLSNQLDLMTTAHPDAPPWISTTVNVDSSGRLVRLEISPPGNIGHLVYTFSGYGVRLSVHLPASDQVTDIAGLKPGGETEQQKGADGDAS